MKLSLSYSFGVLTLASEGTSDDGFIWQLVTDAMMVNRQLSMSSGPRHDEAHDVAEVRTNSDHEHADLWRVSDKYLSYRVTIICKSVSFLTAWERGRLTKGGAWPDSVLFDGHPVRRRYLLPCCFSPT